MTPHFPARMARDRLPFFVLSALVFALDRWSKTWVQDTFPTGAMRAVIDGFFDLTHLQNTGIAFGVLSGSDSCLRLIVLSGFAVLAAVGVVVFSARTPASEKRTHVALALLLGGALGNLYDRVTAGYVTDFLYFHLGGYYWPAFNVADIAISVGVGLMVLGSIRHDLRDRA